MERGGRRECRGGGRRVGKRGEVEMEVGEKEGRREWSAWGGRERGS